MLVKEHTGHREIIIAPHVDDEAIGCWSALRAGRISDVFYLFEVDETRRREAEFAALAFGFKARFGFHPEPLHDLARQGRTFYVPQASDLHRDHQYANALGKKLRQLGAVVKFYSIDMNSGPSVLDPEEQRVKRITLQTLYPSQHKLLEDEKYHLFESIVDNDYRLAGVFSLEVPALAYKPVTITLESRAYISDPCVALGDCRSAQEVLDRLVAVHSTNLYSATIEYEIAGSKRKMEHRYG